MTILVQNLYIVVMPSFLYKDLMLLSTLDEEQALSFSCRMCRPSGQASDATEFLPFQRFLRVDAI